VASRRGIVAALAGTGTGLVALGVEARAAEPANAKAGHRVSFQVDQNDPAVMGLTLNNIANIALFYQDQLETLHIEVVAFGPGLNMLREDTSPVKARIASGKETVPNLVFSACHNTLMAMEKREGKPIKLVPQARIVPAGVVRLVQLQEDGWSYIRT
jgi:intracellular sulfur oxidation DsrE/DsrF family protein